MYFVISCRDKPGHLETRRQTRPAHVEYLASQKVRNLLAGPLLLEDGETPCGSLLIVEAEDKAAAEAFAKGDPYAKAGLFRAVTITPFRPGVGAWLPAEQDR